MKWVGIGVVFVVILAGIGVVITASDSPQTASDSPQTASDSPQTAVSTPPKEIIVTKSPEQLLPVRSDIGTIWKIQTSNVENFLNNVEGHTVGATQLYSQPGKSLIPTSVDVGVFMFDNPTNSLNFYTGKIQRLIEEGGFEETRARADDATCYGLEKSAQSGFVIIEDNQLRCVKGNVYVFVRSSADGIWGENHAPKFMRMVLDKIS